MWSRAAEFAVAVDVGVRGREGSSLGRLVGRRGEEAASNLLLAVENPRSDQG